jgi:16S rRNA (cytidine1402-2'-O)-methyltransferase
LPWTQFAFLGFPPTKQNSRRQFYAQASAIGLPFVVFEAPHRLLASLEDAAVAVSPRNLVICRELTKVHEEFIRTTTTEAADAIRSSRIIGEYTLVFGAPAAAASAQPEPLSDAEVWNELGRLTESGLARRDAVAEIATRQGRSSKDIYAAAERGKRLAGLLS